MSLYFTKIKSWKSKSAHIFWLGGLSMRKLAVQIYESVSEYMTFYGKSDQISSLLKGLD